MYAENKIFLAGHKGLVGSSILRRLKTKDYKNLITKTSGELDLRNQENVSTFFTEVKPEYVILAAARVGGIFANSFHPAEFIYDNLMIQTNIIHQSYLHKVKKLLFLGSSCIYPKNSPNPLKEEYLLTGKLEPTNESYAVAKIAGIKMCQAYNRQYGTNFISVMPTNTYGPGDNFDPETSHVVAALIRKFHEAKIEGKPTVEIWGTGKPKREFLYVDDLADACLFLMLNYNKSEIVNIGTGKELSILELALTVKKIVGYEGKITFNPSMPDGVSRKLLDVTKINTLGWKAKFDFQTGIEETYKWYRVNYA